MEKREGNMAGEKAAAEKEAAEKETAEKAGKENARKEKAGKEKAAKEKAANAKETKENGEIGRRTGEKKEAGRAMETEAVRKKTAEDGILEEKAAGGRTAERTTERTAGRETASVRMDSRSQNEEFARVVAAVFASRLNPTFEELDDIRTAVSEAVTNAVIHGYQNGPGVIRMDLAAEENVFTVSVRDDGVGIPDIERAMEPMFTTAPDGERSGMGFSFMEAFMDQVEVISAPGCGTTVIMRKKIGG